jgi:dienelactone hydrolase
VTRLAAVLALACSLAWSTPCLAHAQACTPFGDVPETLIDSTAPSCPGGSLLGPWPDPDGTPRYACLWVPRVPSSAPRPMLVYLHPSLATADSASKSTNLLSFIDGAGLAAPGGPSGFILLAPTGRNTTHHYPAPDARGTGWDHWYRQFNPGGDVTVNGTRYPENVDAVTIDHFIDEQVATGAVDTQRIFLSGWSNGTSLAYEYALNRPNIAAIAVYSGASPYQRMSDPCPQLPVTGDPASNAQIRVYDPRVPTYQVHNNCDGGGMCPNVTRLDAELRAFGAVAQSQIITGAQKPANKCLASCGHNPDGSPLNPLALTLGLANHIRWPDDWTDDMLAFLKQHPLGH